MSDAVVDDPLRVRALEILGPLGDALARAALESGTVRVEHDIRTWEGSHGTVHAHRVEVHVTAVLCARAAASHATRDALAAALAAAMAERPGQTLDGVRLAVDEEGVVSRGPYRDPRC